MTNNDGGAAGESLFEELRDSALQIGEELVALKKSMTKEQYNRYVFAECARRMVRWMDDRIEFMVQKDMGLLIRLAANVWEPKDGELPRQWGKRIHDDAGQQQETDHATD